MKATVGDLRHRTKDILDAVERGQTVTITHRGKERARIVPIPARGLGAKLHTHEAFGLWKDRDDLCDVPGFVRGLRKSRS